MNQKQVWNNIAPEWFEFRQEPSWSAREFLKKQKGKIIDLGSGAGRHLMKIKNSKMYLIDFSPKMIKLAKKKAKEQNIDAEFKVSPMHKIPYENDFFDAGICFDSLHCIESEKQREQAVKELFRVLKPKAQALISVWNKGSKRFKNAPKEKLVGWRDKGKRYYYLYDEKEIYDLFKKVGFKIKKKISHNLKVEFIVEKC
ncbi:MAG: class I SAM-dependent methyltransferase [Nanoarchaeota archaeon]|nr:class I SAM-dependent methyltransferase [Nanoarchaeota archaeon]